MASNFYFVFVKKKNEVDLKDFLDYIGYGDYSESEQVDIWGTSKPKTLFIGEYNNYLIFSDDKIPISFCNKEPTEIEKKFIMKFPDTEIAAFILNESVGFFGYTIIENGIRKKLKHGYDGEIHDNIGDILPQEIEMLNSQIFIEEELEEMEENGEDINALIEFEASYRVTGKLISERLGKDFYKLKDGEVTLSKYIQII
jgi:hypothetical protein